MPTLLLRVDIDSPEQEDSARAILHEPLSEPTIDSAGKLRIRVNPLFCFESIFFQPLHQRKMEASALI